MNIWTHAYPENFNNLIELCDLSIIKLEKNLNSDNCKTLADFYEYNNKGELTRNKDAFTEQGYISNSRLNDTSKSDNELSGLYVFGEYNKLTYKVIPRYIGISRTIYRRLKQHGWGKLHNEATFATLKHIYKSKHIGLRTEIPLPEIQKQQEIIKNYKVAILPMTDYYTMYFMEVYLAGKWKTEWNSFKTH